MSGTVGQQKTFYREGAIVTHPSGAVFKRVGGKWVKVSDPPEAKTT